MDSDFHVKLLLVDDEERLLEALSKGLRSMGNIVLTCSSGALALELLKKEKVDVLVTDLVMPEMDGMELMQRVKLILPGLPVIILTGHGTIQNAVHAMQKGAFNYITKPPNLDEVNIIVGKAAEMGRIVAENVTLREQVDKRINYAGIIGESMSLQKVYRIIDRVKDTGSTVLITGESGTGKELVAKAIHYNGLLKNKPFVTVDCGSLTETLLESELFGHAKGAFTGAHRDRAGYFEAAHKGTIFLDEIGEFNPGLQTRLLRVLQDGEFSRVGDNQIRKADVRIIAATNKDLSLAVTHGRFREDLFYRLNVITIHVPPLRERIEDIPELANHFLERHNKKLNRNIIRIAPDAMEILMNYPWPGNIRELENLLERLVTFCDGEILKCSQLPTSIIDKARDAEAGYTLPANGIKTYKDAKSDLIHDFTNKYLEKLLDEAEGSIKRASEISGMDRACLYRLMKKHEMTRNGIDD